jgi:hypothetical protein
MNSDGKERYDLALREVAVIEGKNTSKPTNAVLASKTGWGGRL